MSAIPFVYFAFLSYCLYIRKKELDLAVVISMIYTVSGFFTLLLDAFDLRDHAIANYKITILPALLYCGLLTMCLMPFIIFGNRRFKRVLPVRNETLLKIIAWAVFIWFAVYVILSFNLLVDIITGDMGALRNMLYQGIREDSFMQSMPFYTRVPFTVCNMVFGCYWIFIFLAFYCLLIQQLPMKYFWLFIIASLSGPWGGILGLDRSRSTYWIISFVIVFLFYWPYMTKKLKKMVSVIMLLLIGIIGIYIFAMTSSRFGESSDGAGSAVISYLGQNFTYFCYFFDTFDCRWSTLSLIFPFTNKFIFGDEIVGGVIIQEKLTQLSGQETGVFYTFIGQIMISAGWAVAILWCIIYMVLAIRIFKNTKCRYVSLNMLFLYMLFASNLFLGLWTFFYENPSMTFSSFCFLIMTKIMGKQQPNGAKSSILSYQ